VLMRAADLQRAPNAYIQQLGPCPFFRQPDRSRTADRSGLLFNRITPGFGDSLDQYLVPKPVKNVRA